MATGFDFTMNAVALADVAARPYLRSPNDPYPGFAAAEVDPWSAVVADGYLYRSIWNSGRDAVTAVLMARHAEGEFVLDPGTASRSEFVVTLPTKPYHATAAGASPPFIHRLSHAPSCGPPMTFGGGSHGEEVFLNAFNRAQAVTTISRPDLPLIPSPAARLCGVANAIPIVRSAQYDPALLGRTVMGSTARPYSGEIVPVPLHAGFTNGRVRIRSDAFAPQGITSLAASTRIDVLQGTSVTGPHRFEGLPIVGFTVRTFENGTLACGTTPCQGNYGGLFPLTYTRWITVAP